MLKLGISMTVMLLSSGFTSNAFSEHGSGPRPVQNFDIERYQGVWHELASIPASFQEDCVGNTTAEYTLLKDGKLKVYNSCERKNGKRKGSEARARVNRDYGLNSTLEVTFVKIFGWIWAFSGDYWVTYISKDYDLAIVGHPEYKYGWILSKKKTLSADEYIEMADELTEQGYNPCRFMMSNTPLQAFKKKTNLCDYILF